MLLVITLCLLLLDSTSHTTDLLSVEDSIVRENSNTGFTQDLNGNVPSGNMSENHPPTFTKNVVTVRVPENSAINTILTILTATDQDTGGAGRLTYSLTNGDGNFVIDHITGALYTARILDYEVNPNYTVGVKVSDHGDVPQFALAVVNVLLIDVNDNAPVFMQDTVRATVVENVPIGTRVVTMHAIDADTGPNANITLSIVSSNYATNAFQIDPVTGTISTASFLDREAASSYKLVIEARDNPVLGVSLSSTATCYITVSHVNDNTPVFNVGQYSASVMENRPVGTPIIQVTAMDMDIGANAVLSYSLSPQASRTFYIDQYSGMVYNAAQLDREVRSYYQVQVMATDHGIPPRTASATLTIRVGDENDNAPRFLHSEYHATLSTTAAVGEVVLNLVATDADMGDNGKITYSLLDTPQSGPPQSGPFMMNASTGQIYVARSLEHNTSTSYHLVAIATDHGNPSHSTSAQVLIYVTRRSNVPVDQIVG